MENNNQEILEEGQLQAELVSTSENGDTAVIQTFYIEKGERKEGARILAFSEELFDKLIGKE